MSGTSARVDPIVEKVALRVLELLDARTAAGKEARRAAALDDLAARVREARAENPNSSANQIAALVGGRRRTVLDLVKAFDAAQHGSPSPGTGSSFGRSTS